MPANVLTMVLLIGVVPFVTLPAAAATAQDKPAPGASGAHRPAAGEKPAARTWQDEMKGLTPAIFSDHMVLQREVEVPVWGKTEPGGTVTVTFMNQTKTATADDKGKWMVKLDKMEAVREPQEMTVTDGKETRIFKDVLVGEVWLGSGQSNMSWTWRFPPGVRRFIVKRDKLPEEKLQDPSFCAGQVDKQTWQWLQRAADNPLIRVSTKVRGDQTPNTGWTRVDKENVQYISALAGCIAIHLQEELQVPVGIIVRAVSSTKAAQWFSPERALADPVAKAQWEKGRGLPRPKEMGNLYREYIVPIRPYAIRGVLWDQGESGIGIRDLDWLGAMHALVTGWQADWGQGDLPWSATNHYDRDYSMEGRMRELDVTGFMIARTGGLSRALHPPNKWKYAQKHLDNIFPRVYGRPAPWADDKQQ